MLGELLQNPVIRSALQRDRVMQVGQAHGCPGAPRVNAHFADRTTGGVTFAGNSWPRTVEMNLVIRARPTNELDCNIARTMPWCAHDVKRRPAIVYIVFLSLRVGRGIRKR